jgi:hypothetical protein
MRSGLISDVEKENINLLELLKTNQIVVLSGQLRREENDSYLTKRYNAYCKLCIFEIVSDLMRYFAGDTTTTYLQNKSGCLIMIDEVDSLAPNRGACSARETIVNIATKYRKAYITLLLATQLISRVDDALFAQVNYLITSVVDEENKKLLRNKNVSEEAIGILSELRTAIKTTIGTLISELAIINMESMDTQYFYPIPPLTALKKG